MLLIEWFERESIPECGLYEWPYLPPGMSPVGQISPNQDLVSELIILFGSDPSLSEMMPFSL